MSGALHRNTARLGLLPVLSDGVPRLPWGLKKGTFKHKTMIAVILAGGYGTRISEETHLKPKPMVTIGNQPILWHIMKLYSHAGINDFVICCGYKANVIKQYFANYYLDNSDITFNMSDNSMKVHQNASEPWKVTLVDTGEDTMTGGRLKRVGAYLDKGPFCFTYGDGVSDVDIPALVAFHGKHGKLATVTAVQPPGRFGALSIAGDTVKEFQEKPEGDGSWVSGGFFVLDSKVVGMIEGDSTNFEKGTLEAIAAQGQLKAHKHRGFWQPMDTLRDKMLLDDLWRTGKAPWKKW